MVTRPDPGVSSCFLVRTTVASWLDVRRRPFSKIPLLVLLLAKLVALLVLLEKCLWRRCPGYLKTCSSLNLSSFFPPVFSLLCHTFLHACSLKSLAIDNLL
jgi:hypothetical protein